jgi:DNA adenine methylase
MLKAASRPHELTPRWTTTPEIFINDADTAIHDFWWAIKNRPKQFAEKLSKTRVCMAEWRRQRSIYRSDSRISRLDRGFSAFYLNRCNRSGIIMNGGPIGGVKQEGEWLINARFNKPELLLRCQKIAEYRDRIYISGDDGIDFVRRTKASRSLFFMGLQGIEWVILGDHSGGTGCG